LLISISICIPTYNRLPHLKELLFCIVKGFADYPYEIIIADGGSTDGTIDYVKKNYIKKTSNVTLIEQGELTGAVKACNECFKIAQSKYIFPISADFILKPAVIIKACNFLDREKQIGIVIPKVQNSTFGYLHEITLGISRYGIVWGKSFIFRTSVLKEMNLFDESFRTYHVESNASLSALIRGYTTIFTRETAIEHNRTPDTDEKVIQAVSLNKEKSLQETKYFREKWKRVEEEINEYLKNYPFKKYKSRLFRRICSTMYYAPWLQPWVRKFPTLSMRLYDHFLDRIILFRDRKYDNLKDFFLPQRFPDEIISSK
jgi:glycosyltransferase involved in cell wall biosynthesis